jgi:hypothetical protein
MLPLHHRDLDHRDLVHHLVHDLVLLQLMEHLDGMDHHLMVRRNLSVADIAKVNLVHLLDVVKMDEQQNLDELNRDEVLTFRDVVHHFRCFPEYVQADVQADVEPRHLLRTDYFLDVADAEQRHLLNHLLNHLLKRDYFLDVEQVLPLLQNFLLLEVHLEQLAQSAQRELALQHVEP